MGIEKFDLQNKRFLRLNAIVSLPLYILLLSLSIYLYSRGETGNGNLLLAVTAALLVLHLASFAVLARRGVFKNDA